MITPYDQKDNLMGQPSMTPDLNTPVDIAQQATTFNPGIKQTGAPVTFSPRSQATMTGVFGAPMYGKYDRTMGMPKPAPAGVQTPITPPYDLNY
jgi:hypothetical protein